MPLKRFLIDPLSVDREFLYLRGDQFHHAVNVLRLKKNDCFDAVDGKGSLYRAKILAISSEEASCFLLKRTKVSSTNRIEWSIALSVSREKTMKFMLQKSVELGTKSIFPYFSNRSQGPFTELYSQKKKQRWSVIIEEALKQSGNNFLPELTEVFSFDAFLSVLSQRKFDHYVVLSPWTEKSFTHFDNKMRKTFNSQKILFCLGPEGGLTKEEEAKLILCGGKLYHCGKLLMRVETAFMFVASSCALWNLAEGKCVI